MTEKLSELRYKLGHDLVSGKFEHFVVCDSKTEALKIIKVYEENRWIPVGERLPEKTEEDLRPEVLVYDGESVTGALWRHYSFGWDFETDRGKPTHWKPITLPE